METLEAALQEVENIPAYLPNCLQLQDVVDKAKNWLQEAEALQVTHVPDKTTNGLFVRRMSNFNTGASSSGVVFLCWTASLSWFSEQRASL